MSQSVRLSKREQEVVKLLLEGKSNKMIASALGITVSTVEFHLKKIYAKFDVSSRMELVLKMGQSAGANDVEETELRESIVAEKEETAENKDQPNERNWVTSLRETFSLIGKELKEKMENSLNSENSETVNPTFFEAVRVCLVKYAEFNGLATRAEFWWFALFVTLAGAALVYINQNLSNVFLIAMLLPLLAAGTRRLRESGRSGWLQLYLLVPVAGIVILGYFWALPPENVQPSE